MKNFKELLIYYCKWMLVVIGALALGLVTVGSFVFALVKGIEETPAWLLLLLLEPVPFTLLHILIEWTETFDRSHKEDTNG